MSVKGADERPEVTQRLTHSPSVPPFDAEAIFYPLKKCVMCSRESDTHDTLCPTRAYLSVRFIVTQNWHVLCFRNKRFDVHVFADRGSKKMRASKMTTTGAVAADFQLSQCRNSAATAVATGMLRRRRIISSFQGLRLAVAASHPLTTPSLRRCNGEAVAGRGWSMDRSGPLSFFWRRRRLMNQGEV